MYKLFFFFVIAVVYSCGTNSQKDKSALLTEKEFTNAFLDSLKRKYPENISAIKQDLEIEVKIGESKNIHNLHNAYNSYKNEPDSLSPIMNLYLRFASDMYKGEEPLQKKLIVPVIKDAGYLDDIAKMVKNKGAGPEQLVYEKYNDKLVIIYGEDQETGISYFSTEKFMESGISRDSLLSIAIKNLDSILSNIEILGEEGYYMLKAGGTYETSLILSKQIWTKENLKVKGDIVIAIPTRDVLLVTGSKDTETLKEMRTIAKDGWQKGPYQLTPDLFRWNGKKFEPF